MMRSLEVGKIPEREETYIWDYCNEPIKISSRIALACVNDAESYRLLTKFRDGQYDSREVMQFIRCVDYD